METTLLTNQGSDEPDRWLVEERSDNGRTVGPWGLDEGGGRSVPREYVIRE